MKKKFFAAEVTKYYHSVKHNLSYNSQDYETKLESILYNDSRIAETYTGKNKG